MSTNRLENLIRNSRLYQDLWLDHRDAMYRAMTFIAQRGGPATEDNTKQSLIMHRSKALNWLLAQKDLDCLLAAYEDYLRLWSPVFID